MTVSHVTLCHDKESLWNTLLTIITNKQNYTYTIIIQILTDNIINNKLIIN